MAMTLVFQALVHFLKLHFLGFLTNHLINIPLSLFIGVGKYAAFCIALVTDVVQLSIYYSALNHTSLAKKFGWHLDKQMVDEYKEPSYITKLPRHWAYLGVTFLALLPIYFGGLFVSVFTAHLLKLDKRKGMVAISIGSLIGCFIWTIGVWSLIGSVFSLFHH
jgi:uncharacterized membrane protein